MKKQRQGVKVGGANAGRGSAVDLKSGGLRRGDAGSPRRVGLYLRVSTQNGQTVDNQRRELEAIAARSGWEIVARYEDNGISGSKGRDKRPGLDALMRAATKREFDMVMAWSVDRLGRSLQHLVTLFAELQALGVGVYLHQQSVDSTTPAGKALVEMSMVFAQFEREMLRERVFAGLARARAQGKVIGRPKVKPAVERKILENRAQGVGMLKIGRLLGVGTATVQRVVKEDLAGQA